ncbi:low molecular weight protein-tyrosine-phosphatase [Paraburkholderia sabiae]|uniref:protein-tyrosine-phosphatase n=1 Tax=Paraburkholderia sabiae TaxID=273251 RepID=A0ABU9QBX5_9BURK|nr:low molecular weight protein-tyrosine-phosphatase [Paraburkholderia sabiae]WJZ75812.1 low molecular weight protein-tyrosine-phosphatase [Paraburkholderia sabiae]CAD6561413.1 Low molecular weight protein-tyrosine-phosphatase Ptp [Paraburkholderia sabiae]
MFSNVLIVCYANICRSPAAEVVFNALHERKSARRVVYRSAGIRAFDGLGMDPVMQSELAARGWPTGEHYSRRLQAGMVIDADLVLVAEKNQIEQIEALQPTSRGKVFALGKWAGIDVADPYGKAESLYRETLNLIERCAESWIDRIC